MSGFVHDVSCRLPGDIAPCGVVPGCLRAFVDVATLSSGLLPASAERQTHIRQVLLFFARRICRVANIRPPGPIGYHAEVRDFRRSLIN